MLLCHEGLPRSGKSYESIVFHLIPALQKGRKTYARIDGLNYEKIAEVSGVALEKVNELLIHITEEQVQKVEDIPFEVGSLVILDEAQNYWPESRQPLNPKLTKFVAEHGHLGLDILWMTQNFADVHKLWKNRTSQLVSFQKLDMIGKSASYKWRLSKAVTARKFERVNEGIKKYDPKYFGTYKSFDPGAEGAQLYEDKRANLFSSGFFKKILPVVFLIGGYGIYYVYNLFNGGLEQNLVKDKKEPAVPHVVAPAAPGNVGGVTRPIASAAAPAVDPQDYIQVISEKYRLRLTAVLQSSKKTDAIFEWYDDSLRVVERMPMLAIARLGYTVKLDDSHLVAVIRKGNKMYTATQFPIDANYGKSSERQQEAVRGSGSAPGGSGSAEQSRVVVLPADGYGVLGAAPGRNQASAPRS